MYNLPHSKNFGVKLTLCSYRYVATRIVMSRVIACPSYCDPSFYFDDIDLSIISKNTRNNEKSIFDYIRNQIEDQVYLIDDKIRPNN